MTTKQLETETDLDIRLPNDPSLPFSTHVTSRLQDRSREELLTEIERQERFRADFLVLLAHEIRAPLAPLVNCLDILGKTGAEATVRDRTRTAMEQQIVRLQKLSDGLLEVSRVTYGHIPLQHEPVDLARMTRLVVAELSGPFDKAGLTTFIQVPETPVWVRGDPIRVKQIVSNLVENACTFTEEGGVVEIFLNEESETHQARLRVRDNGIGIEPSLMTSIFEPFCQASRTLDRSRGGLGLGLALIKGLVALHGGVIDVSSDGPGRGSEFLLRLPLEGEPQVLKEVPLTPTATGRSRVLVIEDNRDGSETLRRLLEMAGHEVRAAYTGPEGIRIAAEFRPEFVLCDIGLPEMDGWKVADELRRGPCAASCLIAVTGYGTPEDKERSRRHGYQHHFTKPADPFALLALLRLNQT
jgi:signal transduction histidine kinase/CheY-like chemotaxis protein